MKLFRDEDMEERGNSGRRFIEESFPIKEVSGESSQEKNIRHGHISTLHIWWARRPLASSRATAYAALTPAPKSLEEWSEKTKFITELSKWENSLNRNIVERAREEILKANGGVPPKVLDPFAGGGSIPLEALRLGCETYASDYNPVATLILKCTLEYPQKFGRREGEDPQTMSMVDKAEENRLIRDVKRWGEWVLEEVKKEVGRFYPPDEDGSVPVGYIWARTVPCQNPSCGTEIPLMRQYWLAKKADKKVALYPFVSDGKVEFKVVGTGYEPMPEGFNPERGTVRKAVVSCPACGSTIASNNLHQIFKKNEAGQRLVAVVLYKEGATGKRYRIATENDYATFKEAEAYLQKKREQLAKEWGIDPVPDEPTLEGKGRGAERAFSVRNYNMNTWGDLFNSRQNLAIITFIEKLINAHKKMLAAGLATDYSKAITTYLGFTISRMCDYLSSFCMWNNPWELVNHMFARQTLSMLWDYGELNPFSEILSGTWKSMSRQVLKAINVAILPTSVNNIPTVFQSSATSIDYPNDYFDAVLTDPPYYDNIPYSYLSDFFYVWLKRSIGDLYPDLFSTPLTPKSKEIVAYSNGEGGWEGGKRFFEEMLKKAFQEINRVLKPGGIAIIVYAHKSTSGWETLINSLLDSGLVITAAWPIHTEMKSRLRAMESAALGSSIYIVARKMQRAQVGAYKDVKEELKEFLNRKMEKLWNEGVSGADFFVSAIGASVQVFGRYEKIIREDTTVRADILLEDVRRIVTDYAVRQVLHNGIAAEISNLTRFYLLWRWSYGETVLPFDEARKLAQSTGIDLAQEWTKPNIFIEKQKELVRLLGPKERTLEDLKSVENKDMIDVLHLALLLWQKGDRQAMLELLSDTGYGSRDSFYRVAQAISESLPPESQEKKLLEGFLAGRERLSADVRQSRVQRRLFE